MHSDQDNWLPFLFGVLGTVLLLMADTVPVSALEVLPVRSQPDNPNAPTLTYTNRPLRLKAVARGLNATVYFRWDVDGDGAWDTTWLSSSDGSLEYEYTYPVRPGNWMYQTVVQVTDYPGSATTAFATLPVLVVAGLPDPAGDPFWALAADDSQLDLMANVALDDALWYLHRNMVRTGNNTNTITGYPAAGQVPGDMTTLAALHLLALLDTGHLPAYPPGTYEPLGATPPVGFLAANDLRWQNDPYAEDALRLLNHLLGTVVSYNGIPAADEADDGTTPLPGTNDGVGLCISGKLEEPRPAAALGMAALARSGLEGTVTQSGPRGLAFEVVVQQLVDYLAAAQIDNGSVGAWFRDPCLECTMSADYARSIETGWAVYGLWEAERNLGAVGVHVPDRVKERLPFMLQANPATDGGARYANSYNPSLGLFHPTGRMLLASRWLGWDQFAPDDTTSLGVPGLDLTRGGARQLHDGSLQYLDTAWLRAGAGYTTDPNSALWSDGNPTSGLPSHSYFPAMLGVVHSGTMADQMIGSHSWKRDFLVDLVWQQQVNWGVWTNEYTSSHFYSGWLGNVGMTAYAAAVLAGITPTGAVSDVPATDPMATSHLVLGRAYPNPFNPATNIPFSLDVADEVTLGIYDLAGRLVTVLVSKEMLSAGNHSRSWDGSDSHGRPVAAGVYRARVKAGGTIRATGLVLVK